MGDVRVKYRDGEERLFQEGVRVGGSYVQSVKYEGNFVLITDVWGNVTAIPADIIQEVKVTAPRGGW